MVAPDQVMPGGAFDSGLGGITDERQAARGTAERIEADGIQVGDSDQDLRACAGPCHRHHAPGCLRSRICYGDARERALRRAHRRVGCGDGNASRARGYSNSGADQHTGGYSCNRSTATHRYAATGRNSGTTDQHTPAADQYPPAADQYPPATNRYAPTTDGYAGATDRYAGPSDGNGASTTAHATTCSPVPLAGPGCGHLF